MKKFLFLLLAALPLVFTACSDDDDLPNVDMTISLENGAYLDGTLYVVQGENLTISGITVKNLESGKAAMITSADYYWDGYFLGTAIQPPFAFEIETTDKTPVGRHSLEIVSPLYAVDKDLAIAVLAYPVQVVASEDDMPDQGTTTFSGSPSVSKDSK